MTSTGAFRPFPAPALLAAVLLTSGCGQALATSVPVVQPSPIPTVQAHCAADHPWCDGLGVDSIDDLTAAVAAQTPTARPCGTLPRTGLRR